MQSDPLFGNTRPDPQIPDRRRMLRRSAAALVGASALRVGIPAFGAIQDRATAELPLPKVYGDWPVSMDPAVHIKAITDLFQS